MSTEPLSLEEQQARGWPLIGTGLRRHVNRLIEQHMSDQWIRSVTAADQAQLDLLRFEHRRDNPTLYPDWKVSR